MAVLETDGVQLQFGQRLILNNVYIRCETGQVVGLIGRNGSGKSCLLKIIFGTLKGDYQSVRIDGTYQDRAYRKSRAICYLPQNGFLLPDLTLNKALEIFDLTNLQDLFCTIPEIRRSMNKKAGNLSIGMVKLFETLLVLYSDAKFLLLDEPFSFLSPLWVEIVVEHIRKQGSKKGIILTDHQFNKVFEVCEHLYLIRDGVLYPTMDRAQLIDLGYLRPKDL